MKGSPAKLGTIQGTSGHVSALKQAELSQVKQLQEYEAEQKLIALKKEAAKKAKKKAKKEITKKELKEKGVKDEDGNYILGEMERADTKYDSTKDYSKPDPDLNLSKKAAKRAKKKNLKSDSTKLATEEYQTAKENEAKKLAAEKKEAMTSNKTRNLRAKSKKVSEKLKKAKSKGPSTSDSKIERGVSDWWNKRRVRRLGKKEDKLTDATEKSETYDTLSPDEKTAHQREKMAYLTAMFDSDARTMAEISKGNYNEAKQYEHQTAEEYHKNDENNMPEVDPFAQLESKGNLVIPEATSQLSKNVNRAYGQKPGAKEEEEAVDLTKKTGLGPRAKKK